MVQARAPCKSTSICLRQWRLTCAPSIQLIERFYNPLAGQIYVHSFTLPFSEAFWLQYSLAWRRAHRWTEYTRVPQADRLSISRTGTFVALISNTVCSQHPADSVCRNSPFQYSTRSRQARLWRYARRNWASLSQCQHSGLYQFVAWVCVLFTFAGQLTDVVAILVAALTQRLVAKAPSCQVDRSVCSAYCECEVLLMPPCLRTHCHCSGIAPQSESTSFGRGTFCDILCLACSFAHCLSIRPLLRLIRPLRK